MYVCMYVPLPSQSPYPIIGSEAIYGPQPRQQFDHGTSQSTSPRALLMVFDCRARLTMFGDGVTVVCEHCQPWLPNELLPLKIFY